MISDLMQLMDFSFHCGFWNGVISFMFFGLVSATLVGIASGIGNLSLIRYTVIKPNKENSDAK
jgi:hypothetical protein